MNVNTKFFRAEMKLRGKIARRLSWLWQWQQALHRFYAHSPLKALGPDWSYTHAMPELAYVYVENANFQRDTGR